MNKYYTELELVTMANDYHRKQLQSKTETLKETICTVGIGYIVSLMVQMIISKAYGLPLTTGDNAMITGIFTITSLIRVYAIRRIFNGRPK